MDLIKHHFYICNSHTHLAVVECKLQFLFVYVYEPAVKEGWILVRLYMDVCGVYMCKVHIHMGLCLYMSAWKLGNEEASERERERVSFVFTMNLHSPARATATPPPTLPSTDGHPSAPSRRTHTYTLSFSASIKHSHSHTHTHTH